MFLASNTQKQPTPDLLVNGQTPKTLQSSLNQTALSQTVSPHLPVTPTQQLTKSGLEVQMPSKVTGPGQTSGDVFCPTPKEMDILGISLPSQDMQRTQIAKSTGNYLYFIYP